MAQNKDTIKSLRKQNDDLKEEIANLRTDFKCKEPSEETQKSLNYLGEEYDDLKGFSNTAKQQISRLESRLTEITKRVELLSKSFDEAQQYSYSYNVKLMGIPHLKPRESAQETSELCAKIFQKMGAEVTLQDIDIAHLVPTRKTNDKPKPIICKFTRRLAREQVMAARKYLKKLDPSSSGLPVESTLMYAAVYDYLTPRNQQLLAEAKKFQNENGFSYCWTKNGLIYLRKTEGSNPIKITQRSDMANIVVSTS
ncbi:uncharacterized protein LOC114526648 [Dendronephthya gigantea]|uniref:uncharacterized protein LOC114526648 n=1 Tax=Dendronephthya gigantea TaxID=151771 RepID=UPI00106A4416|nr:uncharacterized protein LOC114526648 [Dendronephthya gigantea]